jgi:hypothetical protein
MISTKIERKCDDESETELVTAQAFPTQEGFEHDLDDPQSCWCKPEMWVYFDLDGAPAYCVADHHYAQ